MISFDNRISWMDIVAITGAGLALVNAYYGTGAQVDANTSAIESNQKAIVRIESEVVKGDNRILKQVDELKDEVKEIRKEAKDGRQNIEKKLDRLIERELSR